MRPLRPATALGVTALVATLVVTPAAARGGPPADRGGPSAQAGGGEQRATADAPDWAILQDSFPAACEEQTGEEAPESALDDCRLVAPSDLVSFIDVDPSAVETVSGEIEGAAYVGQKPSEWNGRLVVWAHGYRGEGPALTVDPPPLFAELVADGTAWIASSYRRNSYDPGIGVIDTKNVTNRAIDLWGQPEHTYVAGVSMGGHVIGAAIERFPNLYDGALPACGVMGDVELFDYFLDYNLGAAAIADVDVSYPDADWLGADNEVGAIKSALSRFGPVSSWAYGLNDDGLVFKDFVELGSGGVREASGPVGNIYDVAWQYWHATIESLSDGDFFFALGEGDGTIAFRNGIVGQNSDTVYADEYATPDGRFDFLDDPEAITRVEGSRRVRNAQGQKPAPIINGTPQIPVLTMHTIGDLFVPIEMQQIYAEEVAANDLTDNLVQRAIRDVGHCTFSDSEWREAYIDLFGWVEDGDEPSGDTLTGDALANPALGLAWTINDGTTGSGSVRFFGGRPGPVAWPTN